MRRLLTAFTAALVLSTMTAGSAFADCDGANRIEHDQAECLHGKVKKPPPITIIWGGPIAFLYNVVEVGNNCPELGTVVAEVDIKGGPDLRYSLVSGSTESYTTRSKINGIYCCADLGICQEADAERH